MMTTRRSAAAAVVPLCLLVAGCFPAMGEATPTPAPPTNTASAETDQQRQMRLDYEATEKVYRASSVEADKFLKSGATKPPAAFRAVATGDYLDLIMNLSRQINDAGYTTTGGTVIRGVVDAGYKEKRIKLISCEDVSSVKYFKDGKQVKNNSSPYYVQHYTVTKTDAKTWKVSDVDTTQLKSLEGQPCAA